MPGLLSKRPLSAMRPDDEHDNTMLSARPSKRSRLANGRPDNDASLATPGISADSTSSPPTHQPGSIVRVTLKNFVTYTNAEFLPGPSLNMVIGPNGTGKSTLVCAICLGLGWKTEHLGRAKDPSEFVKHGYREATIEIELARDPRKDRNNHIVKHVIGRGEGTKSVFYLNGKQCAQKHIIELCRSFSIQVDNLCQFLPQDRVVEFAALSPVDLLTQTQRAAAPERLGQWHDQLKDLRYKQKGLEHEHAGLADALKTLDGRQNNQRADVERLRERAEIKEKLEAVEMLRPLALYRDLREKHMSLRQQRREAQQELNRMKAEAQPSRDAVTEKQEYRRQIEAVVQQKKRVLERAEKTVTDAHAMQARIKDKIADCRTEIDAEQENVSKDKQARKRLENDISELKKKSEMPAPQLDTAEINERLRDFTRQARDHAAAAELCHRDAAARGYELREKKTIMERLLADIDSLKTQAGQQGNKLLRASEETHRAWQWVQENQDRLPGVVHGPPIVTCSVTDVKYADAVESILGNGDLLAFTVTSRDTYAALSRMFYSELKLADVHIRIVQNPRRSALPIAQDQLSLHGLDCYMTDLITGPEDVINMLCQNRRIDTTAVAFKPLTKANFDDIGKSNLSSYVTPTDTFVITRRREYGDLGVSTRNNRLKTARFFNGQAVDGQAEQDLHARLVAIKGEMAELSKDGKAHQAKKREFDEKRQEAEEEKKKLLEEKTWKQQQIAAFNGLNTRMQTLQGKLDKYAEKERMQQTRQQSARDLESKYVLERAQATMSYMNAVHTLHRLHTELFETEVLAVEALSAQDRTERQNQDAVDRLRLREQHFEELRSMVEAKAKEAKHQEELFNQMTASCTARQAEIQQQHREEHEQGQSAAELETDIQSMAARLDMYHEGDPSVMREYEERGAKIDRTRLKLNKVEHDLGRYSAEIETVQSKWEPELDALISKISDAFSDNFQRIGCAGEVRVHKDADDYAAWAVHILVKFREGEELSVLDSHRQSGGERAVSTIFYLMALQSLARAPFRVVDEINQGMDPRNERLVHARIVDIACAEHTSQYFLITPKLLPNLEYHPGMKVHCIASGEYMPSDHKKLDFAMLAQKALAAKLDLARNSAIAV